MCAYNVRHNKSLDHEPAKGPARMANTLREAGAWALGLAVMYAVYWLVKRVLF
jgi:hypothetical protein